MKIHTDILTHADIAEATRAGGMRGVYTESETKRGSRSRHHSFDVALRGTSTRRPNWGTGDRDTDDGNAASWDEWGMFIQALFVKDPGAIIGMYDSPAAFYAYTGGRFEALTQPYQHPDHRWEYSPALGYHECKFCEAVMNRAAMSMVEVSA